jgi:hypothetical protein
MERLRPGVYVYTPCSSLKYTGIPGNTKSVSTQTENNIQKTEPEDPIKYLKSYDDTINYFKPEEDENYEKSSYIDLSCQEDTEGIFDDIAVDKIINVMSVCKKRKLEIQSSRHPDENNQNVNILHKSFKLWGTKYSPWLQKPLSNLF